MPYKKLSNIQINPPLLWAFAILVGVNVFINTGEIAPNDFWWHMAVGREILHSGQIPLIDTFSHTMYGAPYPSYQIFWLMDLWLYGWYILGGPNLVLFIHSLLITGIYALVLYLCWKLTKDWKSAAFGLAVAILFGFYTWNVRPQAISFLFGSIFLLAIYSFRLKPKIYWLVILPLVMVLWVNSHGSFIIGIVMLGIWFLDELQKAIRSRWQHSIIDTDRLLPAFSALILTAAASLINPQGINIIAYVWRMLINPVNRINVQEWESPIYTPMGPIFIIGLVICIVLIAISPRKPTFYEVTSLLLFGILAFLMVRGVIWFGLVAAPITAVYLNDLLKVYNFPASRKIPDSLGRAINISAIILILILALISLPWMRNAIPGILIRGSVIRSDTPIEATEFLLNEGIPGNIFNDMVFGSYLIWAAQPKYKVYSDPRVELFDIEIWDDYGEIVTASSTWEEKLDKYDVNTLILNREEQGPLISALSNHQIWQVVYHDETALIYVKTYPSP